MNDTQFQIDHLIELAVLQRAELKTLVDSMPQLRDHLSEEIERNLEEAEPAIRSELEQLVIARAKDAHAESSATLNAKIEELAKALEITTAAKYSVLMAERAENANLLAKAEARIEDAASMLSGAVKEIVTDELSRFPRAGEIDQLRKEFAEPRGLNPRGRWMPDETYQRLDLVTINGDSFVSNIDGNRERPSRTAGDWTLSAARGNGGGGGGVTTMTDLVPVPSNGQLLIGNGSAFVNSTLTAGTGISISNGAGSITITATDGNITLDDGTAAAPSLNFTNEATTGLFRASANVMGFAVNGTSRATMTTTGLTVAGTITPTGSVHAAAGSVGNPSLAFNSDQDTGLFSVGANNIGVAVGGTKVLDVASTGLTVTGALGASSLTSPASTPLTLGTGTSGTAITLLSNGIIEVPSPQITVNSAMAFNGDAGTTTPLIVRGATLTGFIVAQLTSYKTGSQTRLQFTDEATYNLGIGTDGSGNFTINSGNYPAGIGTNRFQVAQGGTVSISSTTAGSSGAGALVVAGGISAAGASFFGSTVSLPYAADGNPSLNFASDSSIGIGAYNNAALRFMVGGTRQFLMDNSSTLYGQGNAASLTLASTGTITFTPTGGTALTLTASTLAATFAGAVTVNGTQINIQSGGATDTLRQGNAIVIERTSASGNVSLAPNSPATSIGGAVTIGNTVNSVSPTSPNRTITMVVGGVTLYIAAKTTND